MKSTTWKRGVLTLAGVFALCVALLSGARGAYAEEISGNGWTLNDGVLTLTADIPTATTYDWTQYASQITEVKVAEGVTEIPGTAFASYGSVQYSNLHKVTLSSTVKTIRVSAFADNPSLTEVHLNDGLERVWNCAFQNAGFTEIKLPANVDWHSDVFVYCKKLTSVTIPSGSTWGGGGNAQFYGCTSLENVHVEEGVTEIPDQFLNQCDSLKNVWIPKSVTAIHSTPILNCRIIGYKGTEAERYAKWRQEVGVNTVEFHAIDGDAHEGTWKVTTPATCTAPGQEQLTCDICGAVQTREIAATDHTWDKGTVTTEPTATKEGVRTYTCTKCGATKTETVAALGTSTEQKKQAQANGSNGSNAKTGAKNGELPKTGDNILPFLATLAVSLALISAGVFMERMRASK